MKLAVIAMTRHGVALAGRLVAALPGAQLFVPDKFQTDAERIAPGAVCGYVGPLGGQIPALFTAFDGLIAVISIGALVRLIAPHLRDKTADPAVIVMDEAGQFVIPILSGHLGGANALAVRLAAALGAIPVLTTASDVRQTLAVDLLGREFGWMLDAPHETLVQASAAVVNDEPVALVQEAGRTDWWPNHANGRHGPLPANLMLFDRLEAVAPDRFAAVLWISQRELPAILAESLRSKLVIYRPGLW